jgi:hypothetical protein
MSEYIEYFLADGRTVKFTTLHLKSFTDDTEYEKGYVKGKHEDGSEGWYSIMLTKKQKEDLDNRIREQNR